MKSAKITISVLLFVFLVCFIRTLNSQETALPGKDKIIQITAANFSSEANMTATIDSGLLRFKIDSTTPVPFSQSAVKQSSEVASLGPNPDVPYFTVRFSMPIPPVYNETEVGAMAGIDPMVFHHNHSPGFEILPNGDALAVYFSTPKGKSEADISTSFVQARLRYGSEDWDMPELFFKTQGFNDQSGLLWNDGGKIWFFGGGRKISDFVPFRLAVSTDNGANWTYSIPQIDKPATSYTAQPVTNAFRDPDRSIYFAMDGDGAHSFLWRSSDDGIHWEDMGGRTGGRHSTIIPLDNKGNLLSIGGKKSDVDGWSPKNVSSDWGATWSESTPSPFPPLGTAQRPSMIRLASGNLLFVSDSYNHKAKIPPPDGWEYGNNCFVAISKDNGQSWHIKTLPVQIPAHHRIAYPSLGYVTARQASNGVIHLLTTVSLPPLHYEFNEAWIWSEAGDIAPETSGGTIREYSESYPNGQLRSKWSARICPNGRYLLNGEQVSYYQDGAMQHQVTYANGRKTGVETFWLPDGKKVWTWKRDLKDNRGVWTHYWPNGKKKIESTWNLKPEARDLKRLFFGYLAEGPSRHWDEQGVLVASYHFIKGNLTESGQPPWQQHGKLEVSENGHTIQHNDGTPFLWIGDTAWGMFQQLTREEVDHYLDNRQKLGFTVIQSVVFWYPHGGGIKSGPHNAANAYGHRPFSGEEDAPNTAEPLIVKGGSPDSPNDYWDNVDYVIGAIKKRNMYLALLPCWGRAYITRQFGGAKQEFTEEKARAYGAFLGKRFQQEPHILWVLGGDAKAQTKDYDKRHIFRAMAEGIAQGVTGQQPAWNQAHSAWNQVFMTYHPDGDPSVNSSDWFHEDAWLTANGVEVWNEVNQVFPTMLSEYQLNKPIKPSLFLEGSYEFGKYRHECGWVTPVRVRRQFYHTFFAGGAGHTYGAGPIWAMRGTGGDYNCGYTWKQALEFPGAAQVAGVAKAFLIEHQWSEWIPDQGILDGVAGEGESLKTAVTTESGDMALVYFSNNSHTRVKNTLNKAAKAYWFDPRDGKVEQADPFKQNEARDMAPPGRWEDAILILRVSN